MTTTTLPDLDSLPVFPSAALPDVRGLLAAGGQLIFGGHPSVTPLVQRVASDFLRRHPAGPAYVLGLLDGEAARLIADLEPNGLSAAERRTLHHTTDVDLRGETSTRRCRSNLCSVLVLLTLR